MQLTLYALQVRLRLRNQTDRRMGPLEVCVSEDDSTEERAIMVNGMKKKVCYPKNLCLICMVELVLLYMP